MKDSRAYPHTDLQRQHPSLLVRRRLQSYPRLFMILLTVLLFSFGGVGFAEGHDPGTFIGETAEAALDDDAAPNVIAIETAQPAIIADVQQPLAIPAIKTEDNIAAIPSPEPVPLSMSATAPEQYPTAPVIPDILLSAGLLVDGLQYDIPMPWGHDEFENLRASYMTAGGKKWLKTVMERSLPYLAYIEEKIEEYGLPKELVFLPVIESEYSPYAVSRSGATGIWQFMRNSISGYGLSISDWADDRKDFMKSTDAALRKLKDNYKALGDWLLAIAAYNAGLGAVSRAVRTSEGESIDFWHLYESKKLSREPLSYVPKFLAVASILSYPELHGLPSEWGEKNSWEALETSRQVDLNVLAERTGISLDVLKQGNPELKYHITPPTSAHMLKVPSDKAETAKTVLKDISTPLFKYDMYKVKSGDTLGAIAELYGTSLNIILQANPGIRADKIKIGQTIIIPHLSASATPSKKNSSGESLSFSDFYTVKKGDTLWDISLLFNVQPDVLAERNGIAVSSTLKIGQKLKVPAL